MLSSAYPTKAIELNPEDNGGYYNMSCFYSLQKQVDKACYYLEESIKKGYKNWDWIKKDKDLDNIRNAECYKRIMSEK